jgi:hypothetical protein
MPTASAIYVGLGRSAPCLMYAKTRSSHCNVEAHNPTIYFTELIGGGHHTDVFRSWEMGLVAKVYAISEREIFQNECLLLEKANNISSHPTPHFFGCYESDTMAVLIMADMGNPVEDLMDLSKFQKCGVLP